MTRQTGQHSRWDRLVDLYAARSAGRAKLIPHFISPPEPLSIGSFARGKQILAGNFLLAGHLSAAPDTVIWDVPAPDPAFTAEAQGYAWLDDLAALGTPQARKLAQAWTADWIARFGQGRGPGWTPELTGRCVTRWIHHGAFLLTGADQAQRDAFFRALARQSLYLSRRARHALPGRPRFEALVGLLYAGLSLSDMETQSLTALSALVRDCRNEIDAEGGIASRNPEELLEIMTLLVWALQALVRAEHMIPEALSDAVDRIAPCLRSMRHADGGLARFHSGGKGAEGRLDQALAASAMHPPASHITLAMGFARLSGGRSSVIMDVAAPPAGAAAAFAHASTTAFELTSGRRPLIVSCGPGRSFGPSWQLAGRATQSHSALSINGTSSSRFSRDGSDHLDDRAGVTVLRHSAGDGALVQTGHDGWRASHGLTAWRELHLSSDGRRLGGTDALTALSREDQTRMRDALHRIGPEAFGFSLRFHLHPDVDATLDMGGHAVSMQLRSGEIWVFRHDGQAKLTLQPSFYLEKGRLNPRPCRQIVLSHHASGNETRIGWTLAKAQDTPLAIRDLDRDEPVPI